MKVFISWAGELGRQVGELVRDWLPSVVQAVRPYMSSQDAGKGTRWSADLSRELEQCDFGVLCVTRENLAAPWLNFEAGALSKSVDRSRVSPLLFDLGPEDVEGPFVQFQATVCTEEDVRKLVHAINTACPAPLDEKRIDAVFAMWWPQLRDGFDRRTTHDLVAEILALVRDQQKLLTGQERGTPVAVSAAAVREMVYAWAELRRAAAKLAGDERSAELVNAVEEAEIPLTYLLSQLGGPPITR
jgi:hypothetical protein